MRVILVVLWVSLGCMGVGVRGYSAKCKDMDLTSSEQEMTHMKECLGVVGVAEFGDLSMDKVGCFTKCCMDRMGLVDPEGRAHKENINKVIGTLWTDEELKGKLMEGIGACLETQGSKLKMDDDEACSSFKPLSTCMHKAFMDVCA